MLNDIHVAFRELLDSNDWMDDLSRQKAIVKADNIITLLGFPEYAANEDDLDKFYGNIGMCSWDHFNNAQTLRAFRLALSLKIVGDNRDRTA